MQILNLIKWILCFLVGWFFTDLCPNTDNSPVDCSDDPCGTQGNCTDVGMSSDEGNGYVCECEVGWAGEDCDSCDEGFVGDGVDYCCDTSLGLQFIELGDNNATCSILDREGFLAVENIIATSANDIEDFLDDVGLVIPALAVFFVLVREELSPELVLNVTDRDILYVLMVPEEENIAVPGQRNLVAKSRTESNQFPHKDVSLHLESDHRELQVLTPQCILAVTDVLVEALGVILSFIGIKKSISQKVTRRLVILVTDSDVTFIVSITRIIRLGPTKDTAQQIIETLWDYFRLQPMRNILEVFKDELTTKEWYLSFVFLAAQLAASFLTGGLFFAVKIILAGFDFFNLYKAIELAQEYCDVCNPNPCINGECNNDSSDDLFSCECELGWEGDQCEVNINDCEPNPCVNGSCTDLLNGFMCQCTDGWSGEMCTIQDTNECEPNPCSNGICIDLVADFACQCNPGWSGRTCDNRSGNSQGAISGVFGDPHMSTFDRVRFDCQTAGEFTMVTSLETPEFEIQERFTAVESSVCSQTSISTGVVIRDTGLSTVQLSIPQTTSMDEELEIGSCPVNLFVDGSIQSFSTGENVVANGISINVLDRRLTLRHTVSGVEIRLSIRRSARWGCEFQTQVFLPSTYRINENIIGLLGTPNGIRSDDWVSRNGITISLPSSTGVSFFQPSYNYCVENWCVTDAESSLFSYQQDETFESLSHCTKSFESEIASLVETASATIRSLCEDDIFCVVDGVCGGDNDARAALSSSAEIEALQTAVSDGINSTQALSPAPSVSDFPSFSPNFESPSVSPNFE